jgi:hypothetical protein
MPSDTLYRDDVYAWSKQQAEALREIARRDTSNRVDWENVIEEIDDVGNNTLHAVESALRLIFVHVLKAVADPDARALNHWAGEVAAFHADLTGRFTASMRQTIDLDRTWKRAVRQAGASLRRHELALPGGLPERCPYELDELLSDNFTIDEAVARLRPVTAPDPHRS